MTIFLCKCTVERQPPVVTHYNKMHASRERCAMFFVFSEQEFDLVTMLG